LKQGIFSLSLAFSWSRLRLFKADTVRYTEDLGDIDKPYSDGPFPFGEGLTNTYRIETLEVTSVGELNSFLAQGGQRWQKLRLLTSGSVTFLTVGFKATVDPVNYDDLPGQFTSSNPTFNEVWKLGARAVGAACFPAGAYKSKWDTSSNGTFVRGSRAGPSIKGNSFSNYNLTFAANIKRGGLGWAMAYAVNSLTGGIQLNLVGEYPDTTYANVNKTLLPANSVVLGYGFSLVNQTSAISYYLDSFKVPFDIKEGQWYSISAALSGGVATPSQAISCMNALAALKLSPGYKDSTSTSSSGVVSISPNTNGFLLSALMQTNRTAETRYLFENLWKAMINTDATHSGASWEYVDTDLEPGLSRYTSLAHPWGGAPTYILTEYVAGIRPTSFGYSTWVIAPAYTGFGLSSASAQVQTPFGPLKVQWSIAFGRLNAIVTAQKDTSGEFIINRALANDTKANTVVKINGGVLPKAISLDI